MAQEPEALDLTSSERDLVAQIAELETVLLEARRVFERVIESAVVVYRERSQS